MGSIETLTIRDVAIARFNALLFLRPADPHSLQ
ncbi:protein of unknown function [Acidithiobacillus ferrivorans]|uniref:Uncharacterized protein n=1 Tax=Acidithiobacillus ferrivorans TaxID=160808 RepID=A0A060UMK8_9PROT|nr:hypothetical protein AFERRI_340025 [Acidithiobacillus ferrivorans]SMH65313.1 protein of unknown function [Acidithiobacillus ferrivorans]